MFLQILFIDRWYLKCPKCHTFKEITCDIGDVDFFERCKKCKYNGGAEFGYGEYFMTCRKPDIISKRIIQKLCDEEKELVLYKHVGKIAKIIDESFVEYFKDKPISFNGEDLCLNSIMEEQIIEMIYKKVITLD